MKKLIALLCLAIIALCLPVSGLASAYAIPNQKLALRTGPNTAYVELYTLPQSTSITAYEYEEGNGVTWVLVEYTYQGQVCRGYTGLKRMTVNGKIPWANHYNTDVQLYYGGTVYTAPSGNAGYRGYLDAGDWVTLLDYENGYAYIEFYDYDNGRPSRGYVEDWILDGGTEWYDGYDGYDGYEGYNGDSNRSGVLAIPNQKLALRTGPNTVYTELYMLPQSTSIIAYEYEEGNGVTWVLIEYTYQGQRCRGYTGLKRMSVQGSIPWANHYYSSFYVDSYTTVYAAPYADAGYRGQLSSGTYVTLLDYEGDYAYIEYYDAGTPARGYIYLH